MNEFEKWWHSDEAQMSCDEDGSICEESHRKAFKAGMLAAEEIVKDAALFYTNEADKYIAWSVRDRIKAKAEEL